MSHGPHSCGKPRKGGNARKYENMGTGMREPCAYDGCDAVARQARITDRYGSRYVWVCEGHYPERRQRVLNGGATMAWVDVPVTKSSRLPSLPLGSPSGVPGRSDSSPAEEEERRSESQALPGAHYELSSESATEA
jgi:hypothetical protein